MIQKFTAEEYAADVLRRASSGDDCLADLENVLNQAIAQTGNVIVKVNNRFQFVSKFYVPEQNNG